jgi:hypothetical protein
MNLQTNVETITEQTQLFQSIAIILLGVAIMLFIVSVVFFIVFKIPHSFRVLTGIGISKEIKKAAVDNSARKRATLSWNTSGSLNQAADDKETTVLEEMETTVLGEEETTVLTEEEINAGLAETTLLSDYEDENSLFEMEDDIKITGSNKQI